MAGIDGHAVAKEMGRRNSTAKSLIQGGDSQTQHSGLSQGEGGVFDFKISSYDTDCQQEQWNNNRQNQTEPNCRKKKSAQDRFLGGDKIVPVKIGSYDDVRKGYGQTVPE
jgi:hypothetical protein